MLIILLLIFLFLKYLYYIIRIFLFKNTCVSELHVCVNERGNNANVNKREKKRKTDFTSVSSYFRPYDIRRTYQGQASRIKSPATKRRSVDYRKARQDHESKERRD